MHNLQPLIIESAQLMLIGMGTVFVILIMLIFLINLVSKVLANLKPEEALDKPGFSYAHQQKVPVKSNDELIAVISSAIKTYKKRHTLN